MIPLKRIIFGAIVLIAGVSSAQTPKDKVYIHISGDCGLVLNSDQDRKTGLGSTISFLIPDNWLLSNERNYFTLGVKGLNNPVYKGKFISSINNNSLDAFNYFQFLAGYRFCERIPENGWYFEYRLGLTMFDLNFNNYAFDFSPAFGYVYHKFDFSIFGDLNAAAANTVVGKNEFYTLGVSIGYDIGL